MSRRVRIGVAQLCVTSSRTRNAEVVDRLAGEAAASGCAMVFFPENVDYITQGRAATLAASEEGFDGPGVVALRRASSCHKVWLSLGGVHEKVVGSDMLHNTQLIVDTAGEVRAVYRKAHLFDVSVPGGRTYKESSSTVPGDRFVVVDTPCGRLGLTTCYDLRFPHVYDGLSREGGAEVLTVPSAFMVPTGEAHWHALLRARAIDSQCFIVAAAQCGAHNAARSSYGHSLVVDPWGKVLLDMGGSARDVLGVVELDFAVLERTRRTLPIRSHLRTLGWGPAGPPASASLPPPSPPQDTQEPEVL